MGKSDYRFFTEINYDLTPTSKLLLFDYVSFIKHLRIDQIDYGIGKILKNRHLKGFDDNDGMVLMAAQETFKIFMR